MGNTEEAFRFYQSVFGGELGAMQRMKEVPPYPGQPELTSEEKEMIMHVELPLLGGHMLMGTDMLESMGHKLIQGNNVSINLQFDTKVEMDTYFAALSAGANDVMEPQEMFWGDYFAAFADKFGLRWMMVAPATKVKE
jgi:PhnB protein